jgi:hypothetical protein
MYQGELADGLEPPSHNSPLTADPEFFPYPLMHTKAYVDDEQHARPPWIDPKYAYDYLAFFERPRLPPTWMDPEMFVEMAKLHPRITRILETCYRRNNQKLGRKELPELLDRVLEVGYIPYLRNRFAQFRWIFVQWLMGNYAETRLIAESKAKERKSRKQTSSTRKH